MTTKELNKYKIDLTALAKDKGFESSFLHGKPYLHSNKESLRWLFWLIEVQQWLRNRLIWVQVTVRGENCYDLEVIRWGWIRADGDEQTIIGEYTDVLATGIEIALNKLPNKL